MWGAYMGPRLRSLLSLSLGLCIIVSLRDTTAGHEREALSVLREALNVLCVTCYVLRVMCYVVGCWADVRTFRSKRTNLLAKTYEPFGQDVDSQKGH